jgi:mannose-6-phosphate isomerase-like protein (cupin superfamily)
VDGKTFDVAEGSIVRIATNGTRCIRNNSQQDLYYICIQAKEKSLNIDTFEDGIPIQDEVTWPN